MSRLFTTRGVIDLTGQRFVRLTVDHPSHFEQVNKQRGDWRLFWRCSCDCGNTVLAPSNHLKSGHTKSCGCFSRESIIARSQTHGLRYHPLYNKWKSMRQRCSNPQNPSYKNYGARGINVDPAWADFARFLADMGPQPSHQHTVERKDNNSNYCASNCVWATRKTQANNTRRNRVLTHNGLALTVAQWADKLGVKPYLINNRINKYGWSVAEALTV